jgi:hypothetical protein
MKFTITSEFLHHLIQFQTKVLTGKVLKRIETIPNQEALKNELRELIPEWTREIAYHIHSYNAGIETFEIEGEKDGNR